jgi:hypothetical protein
MKIVLAAFFLLFSHGAMAALAIQRPAVPPGVMHIYSDAKADVYLGRTSLTDYDYLVAEVFYNYKERQEWKEMSADGYSSVVNLLHINCADKTYANNVAIIYFSQPFGTGEVVFALSYLDEPDLWLDDFHKPDHETDMKLINTACELYQAAKKK